MVCVYAILVSDNGGWFFIIFAWLDSIKHILIKLIPRNTQWSFVNSLYHPPQNKVVGGYIGFTPSLCLSVRPSRIPSNLWRIQFWLDPFYIYIYIISSNFRKCVACKVTCKISKKNLAIFLKFVTLTLSCFDLVIVGGGGSQKAGVLVDPWEIWLDFTDNKSTLGSGNGWCCQATSHYVSHCWLTSVSPYGLNELTLSNWIYIFFQNFNFLILFPIIVIYCMKLVQFNKYLIGTVDIDNLEH